MSGLPFDDAAELDGVVGGVRGVEGPPPPADTMDAGRIHVTVSGDSVSEFGALALARDIEHLVRAFHGEAPVGGHELVRQLVDVSSHGERDVDIALHGLRLDPDAEGTLRDLISKCLDASTNPESGA